LIPEIDSEAQDCIFCDLPHQILSDAKQNALPFRPNTQNIGFRLPLGDRFNDGKVHAFQLLSEEGNVLPFASLDGVIRDRWTFAFPEEELLGWVEAVGTSDRISGWAVMRHRVTNQTRFPLEVLVHSATRVLARLIADKKRPDVAEVIGCNASCGFDFVPPKGFIGATIQEIFFSRL